MFLWTTDQMIICNVKGVRQVSINSFSLLAPFSSLFYSSLLLLLSHHCFQQQLLMWLQCKRSEQHKPLAVPCVSIQRTHVCILATLLACCNRTKASKWIKHYKHAAYVCIQKHTTNNGNTSQCRKMDTSDTSDVKDNHSPKMLGKCSKGCLCVAGGTRGKDCFCCASVFTWFRCGIFPAIAVT